MRFRGFKWWREKKLRKRKLDVLRRASNDRLEAWFDMLFPVHKKITITGCDSDEVFRKASVESARLNELHSIGRCIVDHSIETAKALHSLSGLPVLEKNCFEEDGVVKVVATISYVQYELKAGLTEEAFYATVEASDKANKEFETYASECMHFGMELREIFPCNFRSIISRKLMKGL